MFIEAVRGRGQEGQWVLAQYFTEILGTTGYYSGYCTELLGTTVGTGPVLYSTTGYYSGYWPSAVQYYWVLN